MHCVYNVFTPASPDLSNEEFAVCSHPSCDCGKSSAMPGASMAYAQKTTSALPQSWNHKPLLITNGLRRFLAALPRSNAHPLCRVRSRFPSIGNISPPGADGFSPSRKIGFANDRPARRPPSGRTPPAVGPPGAGGGQCRRLKQKPPASAGPAGGVNRSRSGRFLNQTSPR